MRKTLAGTVRPIPQANLGGTIIVHVGALSEDERRYFGDAIVEISKPETAESLLVETFKELNYVLGRNVVHPSRDKALEEIRERARKRGFLP